MELLTLSLENFQGLKHEEIQLDGHSASIYGRNASGKTTIFNAITWLLFGKPSTWAKNWDPKTKGPNGDLHNLEHSATGTFRLDDGQTVTLKKVFREVWKRNRFAIDSQYSHNVKDAGILHIFAVSGLHVGMLAAVTAFLARKKSTWRPSRSIAAAKKP